MESLDSLWSYLVKNTKPQGSFLLEFNGHTSTYETVEERYHDVEDWVSEEERDIAIEKGTVVELHWYPNTPIGFNIYLASDIHGLIKGVMEDA